MIDELSEQRLQEELIFLIRQFKRYESVPTLARHNYIVHILEELLLEARTMQTKESLFNDMS